MSMKPHLICHMAVSVDGRILPKRWRPEGADVSAPYERIHDALRGDAWIIGRISGQEFAKASAYPATTEQRFPREPWFAVRDAAAYGVVLDAQGKIAWGRADIGGDPIVVVLTRSVSDAVLAGLRSDGVSYIFAGDETLDLTEALSVLGRELKIRRLLLEGGGVANGAFLRAGLVNELSLIVMPVVDGGAGAPSVFHSSDADAQTLAPISAMSLKSSEVLDGGAVWLRYRLNGRSRD